MTNPIDVAALAADLDAARRAGRFYVPCSTARELTVDQAYAVQRAFNDLRSSDDALAGFKAAVNAPALQQALGLDAPIVGALFTRGARDHAHVHGSTVRREAFRTLAIETELGFRTAERIAAPLDDVAALRGVIATIAPMLELADPGFGRVRFRGTDLIAANAACGGFVEGPRFPIGTIDPDSVPVRLDHDGKVLHSVTGAALLGDHWRALLWLVNTVIARGYTIEADQLLMTGALGAAHPAAPGTWTGDFGVLGTLAIEVI